MSFCQQRSLALSRALGRAPPGWPQISSRPSEGPPGAGGARPGPGAGALGLHSSAAASSASPAPAGRGAERSAAGLPRAPQGWLGSETSFRAAGGSRRRLAPSPSSPPAALSSGFFCYILFYLFFFSPFPARGRHRPACRSPTCWSYGKASRWSPWRRR